MRYVAVIFLAYIAVKVFLTELLYLTRCTYLHGIKTGNVRPYLLDKGCSRNSSRTC